MVTKTAAQTTPADVFGFSAFDPNKLGAGFRDAAEKSMSQSRDAAQKFKALAEEQTKTLETTLEQARSGSIELGLKTIEAVRANADATLSHFEALLGIRSVSELVELQSAFLRRQVETSLEQAKALQETTKSVAERVAKPSTEAARKAMSAFSL
ncbi:phasin [Xaviernesmea oryzae]|uniref:Phasin n=1 Tax=Xaviernesmea oryzae TaxID=464029 RepID=A0A1Q9ASS2_9HYPH|nr:phasin [Xaviernesmea oryzae]OLP58365.1 phasin [Xaviernesmea oryzae]SEL81850.1 phasin [Xaviernesmea oryzae]